MKQKRNYYQLLKFYSESLLKGHSDGSLHRNVGYASPTASTVIGLLSITLQCNENENFAYAYEKEQVDFRAICG
jgi:hypothetical protein